MTIVIPALNEAGHLPACLTAIGIDQPGVDVRVVDGGSCDETVSIARQFGAQVMVSDLAQRAAQMNLGASHARGDVVLFLHADTMLPPDWLAVLRAAFDQDERIVGGGFRRRFTHRSALLRFTCWLADWRICWWGCLLGDQAMFVRGTTFSAIGEFPTMTVFEDLEFSLRMRELGRMVLLPATVMSSGRRFEARGAARQTLSDFWLTLRYIRSRKNHS